MIDIGISSVGGLSAFTAAGYDRFRAGIAISDVSDPTSIVRVASTLCGLSTNTLILSIAPIAFGSWMVVENVSPGLSSISDSSSDS